MCWTATSGRMLVELYTFRDLANVINRANLHVDHWRGWISGTWEFQSKFSCSHWKVYVTQHCSVVHACDKTRTPVERMVIPLQSSQYPFIADQFLAVTAFFSIADANKKRWIETVIRVEDELLNNIKIKSIGGYEPHAGGGGSIPTEVTILKRHTSAITFWSK